MNARVSLLVLVAFIFMAIWDADRQGKATKPVHATQPMNWHLPLPAPGDELATMATPITPSQAEVEIAVHELTAATEPVAREEASHTAPSSLADETTTVETSAASVNVHTHPSIEEALSSVEPVATHEELGASEHAKSVVADAKPVAVSTEPVTTTEVHEEATSVTSSTEPAAETAVEAKADEIAESADTESVDATELAASVNMPVEEPAAAVSTEIPENLKVADPVMNDRVLNLSRSALAVHEQSLRPISPELTTEETDRQPVEPMPGVESTIVETKTDEAVAVDEVKIVDQPAPEKSGDTTVDYLPVPRNLASGTWQLISQDGEMLEITITRPEQSSGDQSVKDKYAVGTNAEGKRWAFIRVDKSAVADSSKSELQKPEAAPEPVRPVQKAATEFFSPTAR